MRLHTFITSIVFLTLLTSCKFSEFKTIAPISVGDPESESCDSKSELAQRIRDLNQLHPAPTFLNALNSKKIIREEFLEIADGVVTDPTKEFNVKKDSEIILVLNRRCALQNETNETLENIRSQILTTFKNGISQEQSVVWKTPAKFKISVLEKIIEEIPCVVMASPNGKLELVGQVTAVVPNDTLYTDTNHPKLLGLEIEFEKIFPGNLTQELKTPVGVIDTGTSINHPDMQNTILYNQLEKNGVVGVDDDRNGYVDDISGWHFYFNSNQNQETYPAFPHGQHVAGLIGANTNNSIGVTGLAGGRVEIVHLNVFDNTILGQGGANPVVHMEQALRYAADNGIKVVNLSLGRTGRSQTMFEALRYAASKGVFIAAAAGNNGQEIANGTHEFAPAIYAHDLNGMVSVGATNASPNSVSEKCWFSNYSTTYVDIAAYGCDLSGKPNNGLLSTGWYDPTNSQFDYVFMAGTSMATPLVAGAAAFVISYIKEKSGETPTNALVEEILKQGSRHQDNLDVYIHGGRHLDLIALITYIENEILKIEETCQE